MLGFVTNHLDPSQMRGQAYDGASNMSGRTNGASARISSCPIHSLCLSLFKPCSCRALLLRNLASTLKEVREKVDSYHSEWFKTVSDMCREVGTTPSMPRICGRQ